MRRLVGSRQQQRLALGGAPVANPCKSCGSKNLNRFTAEIAIHFPGPDNIDRPAIFVFPQLLVCMVCGVAQFIVPEDELHLLAKGRAPSM